MNKILKKTLPYVAAGLLSLSPSLNAQTTTPTSTSVVNATNTAVVDSNVVVQDTIKTYQDRVQEFEDKKYTAVLDSTANTLLQTLDQYNQVRDEADTLRTKYNAKVDTLGIYDGQLDSSIVDYTEINNKFITGLQELRNREDVPGLKGESKKKKRKKVKRSWNTEDYGFKVSGVVSDKYAGGSFDWYITEGFGVGVEALAQHGGDFNYSKDTAVLDSMDVPGYGSGELYEVTEKKIVDAGVALLKINCKKGPFNFSIGGGQYISNDLTSTTKGTVQYDLEGKILKDVTDLTETKTTQNYKPLVHGGFSVDLGRISLGLSYNHSSKDNEGDYTANLGVKLGKK